MDSCYLSLAALPVKGAVLISLRYSILLHLSCTQLSTNKQTTMGNNGSWVEQVFPGGDSGNGAGTTLLHMLSGSCRNRIRIVYEAD